MDNREWIKQVVGNGWLIEELQPHRVLVKCPARGCAVACWLNAGQVPKACDPRRDRLPADIPVENYEDLIQHLKERRQALRFTLEDVDMVVNWADRYTGKLENPGYQKNPSVASLINWVNALGYEVVLRPTGLPPKAQAVLSEKVFPRAEP